MVFLDLELSDCQIKMIEVVKTNDTGYSSLLFIFFFYVFFIFERLFFFFYVITLLDAARMSRSNVRT